MKDWMIEVMELRDTLAGLFYRFCMPVSTCPEGAIEIAQGNALCINVHVIQALKGRKQIYSNAFIWKYLKRN